MKKSQRIAGIVGLSAIFATTLVLTITLPITIYNNNPDNAKYFKGLNTTTDYVVGDAIKLNVTGVTDPDSYDYVWFMKEANSNQYKKINGVSGSSISLTSAQANWNNAMVYCALVQKPEVNVPAANFLINKSSNAVNANHDQISDPDVAFWTSTRLVLTKAFSVTNAEMSLNSTDVTNGVYLDTKDNVILVPNNQAVTLSASGQTDPVYSQYLTYQWYKNGVAIPSANQSTYTIEANAIKTGDTYYCAVSLQSGPSVSDPVNTPTYKINSVTSTKLVGTATKATVAANNQEMTSIPAGNTVTLSTSFTLGNTPLSNPSSDYSVKYVWYHNNQVISNAANEPTLKLSQVQVDQSGEYYCQAVVSFTNGGTLAPVNSQPVNLTITAPGEISITQQPSNVTIVNGDTASLSVNASINDSSDNVAYQWQYKDPNTYTWTNVTSGGNTATLSFSKDQAFAANGYQFKCVLSCNNPVEQVESKTTNPVTLTVVNPSFTVNVTMTPDSNLKYGSSVTLNAVAETNKSEIPTGSKFTIEYTYQWYKSNNGTNWQPVSNGNQQQITIDNLTKSNNKTQYVCVAYPTNAVVPHQSESSHDNTGKRDTSATDIPEINPYQQSSKILTLNINEFKADVSAFVGTSANPESGTSVTNNLGNKFNLNVKVTPTNGYDNLPAGYQWVYNWQENTTNNSESNNWTDISQSNNVQSPTNVVSNQAGIHYYRCQVSIAKQSNGLLKVVETSPVFTSGIVQVQTYPQLKVTSDNPNVTVAHNGSTTLAPTITVIDNLQTQSENTIQTKSGGADSQLGLCNPVYQWTYKTNGGQEAKPITKDTISEFSFIKDDSYTTGALNINSLNVSGGCSGEFGLTVSLNNGTGNYSLNTPFTVTESPASFSVKASAKAKEGSSTVTLTAEVSDVSKEESTVANSPKSRKARNAVTEVPSEEPTYTYKWFMVADGQNNPISLKNLTGGETSAIQTLTLPSGTTVQDSWNGKVSFYCEVTNQQTGEIEWNTSAGNLSIQNPTLTKFNIQGDTSDLPYNKTITLTATTNYDFEVNNNPNISFTWQYKSNGQWKNITDVNNSQHNVTISTVGTNGSKLQLFNPDSSFNNLEIQCIASYAGATKTASPVTITMKENTLTTASSTTLNNFADSMSTAFNSTNLANTLEKVYGMNKTEKPDRPSGINPTVADQWLNQVLGQSLSTIDLNYLFDKNAVQLSATVVPAKGTLAEVSGESGEPESSESQQNGQTSPQAPTSNGTVTLLFSFTTRAGYKWPSNIATQSSLKTKTGVSYTATLSNSDQTLTVAIPTELTPSFAVSSNSSTSIKLNTGSGSNTITASVKASSPVTSFAWWVIGKDNKPIELSPSNPSISALFGSEASVSLDTNNNDNTSTSTSTLTISNVTVTDSLNNLKIYASGIIDRTGSFWEEWPCTTPFIITVQSSPSAGGNPGSNNGDGSGSSDTNSSQDAGTSGGSNGNEENAGSEPSTYGRMSVRA